jgi:ribonuclease-3
VEDPRRRKQLIQLLSKFGLTEIDSVNLSLIDLALTHPTISQVANYEQLEFVGDSVVRLISAEILMETYPEAPVGDYGAVRSVLVSDQTLAEIADTYGIDRYILITSHLNNPGARVSLLADTFEAILGALYLSTHDMTLIRPWLDPILQARAAIVLACPARENYKDALQEWTQAEYKILPVYKVQENQTVDVQQTDRFIAEVWISDRQLGQGKGRTKKAAEQAAAKEAFFSVVMPK